MALAITGSLYGNSSWIQTASNVLDYVYFYSLGQQGPERGNSSNAAYGLVVWGVSS